MPQLLELTSPLPETDLRVSAISFHEALGLVGEATVDLVGPRGDIDARKLLGQNLTVSLALRDDGVRHINGYVTRLWQSGHRGRHHAYQATLRPWLWFLSRRSNCRIFQDMTVPEIVAAVFDDHAAASFDRSKLFRDYRKWNYCVQYRETDLAFVSRLLEHEGIYYFFEHGADNHKLMLMDSASAHDASPDCPSLPFLGESAQVPPDLDFVGSWSSAQSLRPGRLMLWDHDFEHPSQIPQAPGEFLREHEFDDYEVFDYPGGFTQPGDGQHYAQTRLEELQARFDVHEATTNARTVQAGRLLALERHFRDDQNAEYLVTSTSLSCSMAAFESGDDGDDEVQCRFSAIPSREQYRPVRRTRKPFVQGPQTAVVVGPAGEEIFTDKYGRVKLQFHWDREAREKNLAERSSCWTRVSQPWAGKNFGAMFLPRIGQEVIVDFLEGDPDQPIVTGRVYNAEQMPPWALPANATQSGMLTRSSTGAAYPNANEIKFEDKKGHEVLSLHAEKNMSTSVENDQANSVGHDLSEQVTHDRKATIGNKDTLVVDKGGRAVTINAKGEDVKITGGRRYTVGGGLDQNSIEVGRLTNIVGPESLSVMGPTTRVVTGVTTEIFNGGLKLGVIGELTETVSAAVGFKAGGAYTQKAASFKFDSPGNIEFKANQFNRTVNQANDLFLGPNTGTYIGAASSTMIGGARNTFVGLKNELELALAMRTSIGASINTTLSASINMGAALILETVAGLTLEMSPLGLKQKTIEVDQHALKVVSGGGGGGGGGGGAGAFGPSVAAGAGMVAGVAAAVGNAVAAYGDAAAFLKAASEAGDSTSASNVLMAMAATVLGQGPQVYQDLHGAEAPAAIVAAQQALAAEAARDANAMAGSASADAAAAAAAADKAAAPVPPLAPGPSAPGGAKRS